MNLIRYPFVMTAFTLQRSVGPFEPSITGFKFVGANWEPLGSTADKRWRYRVGAYCITSDVSKVYGRGFHFALDVQTAARSIGHLPSGCHLVFVEADAKDTVVDDESGICATSTLHVVKELPKTLTDGGRYFTGHFRYGRDLYCFHDGLLHRDDGGAAVFVFDEPTGLSAIEWYQKGRLGRRAGDTHLATRQLYRNGARRRFLAREEWHWPTGVPYRSDGEPLVIRYGEDGTVAELVWSKLRHRQSITRTPDGSVVVRYRRAGTATVRKVTFADGGHTMTVRRGGTSEYTALTDAEVADLTTYAAAVELLEQYRHRPSVKTLS
jgi:hypothetical protein